MFWATWGPVTPVSCCCLPGLGGLAYDKAFPESQGGYGWSRERVGGRGGGGGGMIPSMGDRQASCQLGIKPLPKGYPTKDATRCQAHVNSWQCFSLAQLTHSWHLMLWNCMILWEWGGGPNSPWWIEVQLLISYMVNFWQCFSLAQLTHTWHLMLWNCMILWERGKEGGGGPNSPWWIAVEPLICYMFNNWPCFALPLLTPSDQCWYLFWIKQHQD